MGLLAHFLRVTHWDCSACLVVSMSDAYPFLPVCQLDLLIWVPGIFRKYSVHKVIISLEGHHTDFVIQNLSGKSMVHGFKPISLHGARWHMICEKSSQGTKGKMLSMTPV